MLYRNMAVSFKIKLFTFEGYYTEHYRLKMQKILSVSFLAPKINKHINTLTKQQLIAFFVILIRLRHQKIYKNSLPTSNRKLREKCKI